MWNKKGAIALAGCLCMLCSAGCQGNPGTYSDFPNQYEDFQTSISSGLSLETSTESSANSNETAHTGNGAETTTTSGVSTTTTTSGVSTTTTKNELVDNSVMTPTDVNLAKGKTVQQGSTKLTAFTDGNTQAAAFTGQNGQKASFELDLGKKCTFNEIRLYENGGKKVAEFSISIWKDNKWVLIYKQDEIGSSRICSFRPVTAQQIKIDVSATRAAYTLAEVEVFNAASRTYTQPFRVASYITGYGDCTYYGDEDLPDFFAVSTDLIYIGDVHWDSNGYLVFDRGVVKSEAEYSEKISNIRKAANSVKTHKVNVYATIGTPATGIHTSLTGNAKTNLIKNLIAFAKKYQVDGLDFDWEYPATSAQWEIYSSFLVDLKKEMSKNNLKLSVALAPWGVKLSSAAVNAIDYVQSMLYDMPDRDTGNHASYNLCVTSIDYFLGLGFKQEQLNLGLAFYGVRNGSQAGYNSYIAHGITRWDNQVASGAQFNGPQQIRDKTVLAIQNKLGGVMAWNMYCDAPQSTSGLSLYNEIHEVQLQYLR